MWVDFARHGTRGKAASLAGFLDSGQAATCGPVVAEIMAGVRGETADRMWETLRSLRWAEMDRAGWREVGECGRELRRAGRTLPLTDLVIAVSATRSGFALWSFDADFERIAVVLGELELHRLK